MNAWVTKNKFELLLSLVGVISILAVFYSDTKAIPPKFSALETSFASHCAAQVRAESDLEKRLDRIENKLDRALERIK